MFFAELGTNVGRSQKIGKVSFSLGIVGKEFGGVIAWNSFILMSYVGLDA